MRILIVEDRPALASLWRSHLERRGAQVDVAKDGEMAVQAIETHGYHVIILGVELAKGDALIVSDVAFFRQPHARVLFTTSSSFFSDGSLFTLCPNACAYLHTSTAPDDLADVATHYAQA